MQFSSSVSVLGYCKDGYGTESYLGQKYFIACNCKYVQVVVVSSSNVVITVVAAVVVVVVVVVAAAAVAVSFWKEPITKEHIQSVLIM
jgi:hypothetical protein